MLRISALFLLTLLASSAAFAGDAAPCSVRKGLYDNWLALARRAGPRTGVAQETLVAPGTASRSAKEASGAGEIAREYNAFFACLSDLAEQQTSGEGLESCCQEVGGDPVASVVCRLTVYLKGGRAGGKEFLDALLPSKKGAQIIWDLESMGGLKPEEVSRLFPTGPANKLIDELFLLVLDDRETATSKYFNLWSVASRTGDQYISSQVQTLLRESPAVVVKEWPLLRKYQPQLKRVVGEMAASQPAAEMKKMRQGFAAFCTADNLDCPELLKLFGKP